MNPDARLHCIERGKLWRGWSEDAVKQSERASQVNLQSPPAVKTGTCHAILVMGFDDLIASQIAAHILHGAALVTTPQVPVVNELDHLLILVGAVPVRTLDLMVPWQWDGVGYLE